MAVEQRIPRAVRRVIRGFAAESHTAHGRAERRVGRPAEALVEGQVVHGALVAGVLLAVVVRGVGDDRALVEVPLHLQRRQVVLIRIGDALRGRGIELALPRVGIRRPVGRLVVLLAVLIEHAGRHREAARRLPDARQPQHQRVRVVDVMRQHLVGRVADAIDPATVVAVPGAGAKTEGAVDDRAAVGDAELVARLTVLGVGGLAAHIGAGGGEARLRHDVAHRAAFRAGAEQRALRPAQNLDALEVEGLRQRVVGIEADVAHLDRGVVEVDAGGTGPRRGGNAADRDGVGAGVVD